MGTPILLDEIGDVQQTNLPDGTSVTFDNTSGNQWVTEWGRPGPSGSAEITGKHHNLTEAQYEQLRADHPEWKLPPTKKREETKKEKQQKGSGTGNTKGSVQGEAPKSATPAKDSNPPAKPETPKERTWWDTTKTAMWEGSKFIPVVGAIPSGIDAWSAYQQGDYFGASMEAAGILPVGKIAGTVGKLGRAALRGGEKAALKQTEKAAAKVVDKGGKVNPRQVKLKCYKYKRDKPERFDRALQKQETQLNQMTAGELRNNINNYAANSGQGSAAAQSYREAVAERYGRRYGVDGAARLQGMDAGHLLDVGFGGNPFKIHMEPSTMNRSIGGALQSRRKELLDQIKDLPDDAKLNVKLERCKK